MAVTEMHQPVQPPAAREPALTRDGRLMVQKSVTVLLAFAVGLLAVMVVVGIWSLVYLGDIHALVQLFRTALDMFGSSGF